MQVLISGAEQKDQREEHKHVGRYSARLESLVTCCLRDGSIEANRRYQMVHDRRVKHASGLPRSNRDSELLHQQEAA